MTANVDSEISGLFSKNIVRCFGLTFQTLTSGLTKMSKI